MGVFYALLSALVWGSADFCGGLATRRDRPFPVTALAASSGTVAMAILFIITGEARPGLSGIAWALAAGVCGGLGIAFLYLGLSQGNSSLVAPVAALTGSALPLLVSTWLEGWPSPTQASGLFIGLAGIWFVSQPDAQHGREKYAGLGMAILAGVLFGAFFVLIAQADEVLVFGPLTVAKAAEVGIALVIVWARRDPMPPLARSPLALLAGVLDAGGNTLYLLAHQHTRLDIAAILASMYPASTVLLSVLILHEKLNRMQGMGLLLCLLALALIAV